MFISTSSHNVQLTNGICEYVTDTFHNAFGPLADDVVSVDARIEAINNGRDRFDVKAVVRVDLRNHRPLLTEIVDDNLYAAIRRGAADSALTIERQLHRSTRLTRERAPAKFHAFGRHSAANI